jgi:hypothetical protein
MYLSIISVKTLPEYKLHLIFENNEERILDMKPYLVKGVFASLRDVKIFDSVKVSFDSIEWSNGTDLDPEFIYESSYALQPVS